MTHHPRRPAMVQRPNLAPIVLPLLPPEARLQNGGTVTDTLSDVLRAIRLTGAVFFAIDASSPWLTEAPPAAVGLIDVYAAVLSNLHSRPWCT